MTPSHEAHARSVKVVIVTMLFIAVCAAMGLLLYWAAGKGACANEPSGYSPDAIRRGRAGSRRTGKSTRCFMACRPRRCGHGSRMTTLPADKLEALVAVRDGGNVTHAQIDWLIRWGYLDKGRKITVKGATELNRLDDQLAGPEMGSD